MARWSLICVLLGDNRERSFKIFVCVRAELTDNFWELVHSHHIGSDDQTWIIRLVGKYVYQLCHPAKEIFGN